MPFCQIDSKLSIKVEKTEKNLTIIRPRIIQLAELLILSTFTQSIDKILKAPNSVPIITIFKKNKDSGIYLLKSVTTKIALSL